MDSIEGTREIFEQTTRAAYCSVRGLGQRVRRARHLLKGNLVHNASGPANNASGPAPCHNIALWEMGSGGLERASDLLDL